MMQADQTKKNYHSKITKDDVTAAYKKLNDEVGTALEILQDPFRHSLALMEITQTLIRMQIEVGDNIKSKGINPRSKLAYERLQRLLKLTLGLDKIGDMNMNYQNAFHDLLVQLRKSEQEKANLRQELENYKAAIEAVDNDTIS